MSEPQTNSLALLERLRAVDERLPIGTALMFRAAMLGHIASELVRLDHADVWDAALAAAAQYAEVSA